MKIAIIGAGIAGLTTAIAFRQKGFEVTVFEAAPQIKPVGAGLGLAANAMKALDSLGIGDEIREHSSRLNYLEIRTRKGKVLSCTTAAEFRENLCIHRAGLHNILTERAGAANISTGKKATGISGAGGGTVVHFSDGTHYEADLLIVADGINSAIRNQVAPEARVRYAGYTCWRGIAVKPNMQLTGAVEIWDVAGRFGYTPLPDGRIYWYACINADKGKQLAHYTLADLQQYFSGYNDKVSLLLDCTPADSLIYDDINDLQPLGRYAYGNVVLIGDAAHATTPNMGQGACQAIEDAVVLAKCVGAGGQLEDALRNFESQRLGRTHYVINQSRNIGQMAQLENPVLAGLRNMAMKLYPKSLQQKQFSKLFDVTF